MDFPELAIGSVDHSTSSVEIQEFLCHKLKLINLPMTAKSIFANLLWLNLETNKMIFSTYFSVYFVRKSDPRSPVSGYLSRELITATGSASKRIPIKVHSRKHLK